MEKTGKKSMDFNMGAKGYVCILLGFLSIYAYSALMNDSLNIMIPVLAETANLSQTVLYSFATLGTIVGVVASFMLGKLMQAKTAKLTWIVSLITVAVCALIWSQTNSYAVYLVGYLLCYAGCMGCGTIANGTIMSNWFPRKRGLAMGFITAGFPLSAATTSSICNALVNSRGQVAFYAYIAAIDIILAILVAIFVADFPEQKGVFPDNDRMYDYDKAKAELDKGMEYLKTSKWTVKRVFATPRTYHVVFGVGILGFLSMGIMTNFVNKNLQFGFEMPTILFMLAMAGIIAIPGSIFIGWLDVKIGTRKSCVITYCLGIVAIAMQLTHSLTLNMIAMPLFSMMLGGASNFQIDVVQGIWGRYDFKNAFRVVQPLGSILSSVGISMVGVIGTSVGYTQAFIVTEVLAVVGLILFLTLNLDPIDQPKSK